MTPEACSLVLRTASDILGEPWEMARLHPHGSSRIAPLGVESFVEKKTNESPFTFDQQELLN